MKDTRPPSSSPSEDPLDDAIREHYAHIPLSEPARQHIHGLLDGLAEADAPATSHPRFLSRRLPALAAVLFLCSLLLFSALELQSHQRGLRIAQTVATTHSRSESPEYPAADLVSLNAQMTALDFPLQPCDGICLTSNKLLGGRYCALEDKIAAQLKVQTCPESVCTLFAYRPSSSVVPFPSGKTFSLHGVNVHIWKEDQIGYALASMESVASRGPLSP